MQTWQARSQAEARWTVLQHSRPRCKKSWLCCLQTTKAQIRLRGCDRRSRSVSWQHSWLARWSGSWSISNGPPLVYSRPAGTWPVSLLSCRITEIEQWHCIPQGIQKCISRLLLSLRNTFTECINKGGGHTRYWLTIYFVIIICPCLYLFSTKLMKWGGLLFLTLVYEGQSKITEPYLITF